MRAYADTSAVVKLLKLETETAALRTWVVRNQVQLVSSRLLAVELHRAGLAYGLPRDGVDRLLTHVELIALDEPQLVHAERLPPAPGHTLRALDALHLAAALRVGLAFFVAYDDQLCAAAEHHGLQVQRPG